MVGILIFTSLLRIWCVHCDRVYTRKKFKNKKVKSCVNPFFYKELTHVSRFGNLWSLVVKQPVAKLTGWVDFVSCTCIYCTILCVFKKIWIYFNGRDVIYPRVCSLIENILRQVNLKSTHLFVLVNNIFLQ